MAIDVTFPALDFPHRGEFERSEFVNKQELAQDTLADEFTTALNTFKTQANELETNVNNKEANVVEKHDIVVEKEALMSPHYTNIDIVAENIGTIGSKIGVVDIHNAPSKATPVDADELAILDSASSYGLKKLTWANLKATLLTYFDTLYSRTTAIFGIGQTWQNVTASRSLGVTYTNTTGKPIQLLVILNINSLVSGHSVITLNSVAFSGRTDNYGYLEVNIIVPNGYTYAINGTSASTLVKWQELR